MMNACGLLQVEDNAEDSARYLKADEHLKKRSQRVSKCIENFKNHCRGCYAVDDCNHYHYIALSIEET